MRQAIKRRARNFPVRSELKTMFKKQLVFIKQGKTEEAVKLMPMVYSIIDMAVKKNILHRNTAARKKSRLALGLNALQQGKGVKAEEKVAKKTQEKAAAKEEAKAE